MAVMALSLTACSNESNTETETSSVEAAQDGARERAVDEDEEVSENGYELIENPQPIPDNGQFYVEEFFLYSCPHCYKIEPNVEKWLKNKPKDVTFERVPAILGKQWGAYAHVYYVMEHNGFIEKSHRPMFDAIHKDDKFMNNLPELTPFLAEYGMDSSAVKKAFTETNPEIAAKVKKALLRISAYKISSVPTFVVNGKYRVSASTAGGEDKVFDVIDDIIKKERMTQ